MSALLAFFQNTEHVFSPICISWALKLPVYRSTLFYCVIGLCRFVRIIKLPDGAKENSILIRAKFCEQTRRRVKCGSYAGVYGNTEEDQFRNVKSLQLRSCATQAQTGTFAIATPAQLNTICDICHCLPTALRKISGYHEQHLPVH